PQNLQASCLQPASIPQTAQPPDHSAAIVPKRPQYHVCKHPASTLLATCQHRPHGRRTAPRRTPTTAAELHRSAPDEGRDELDEHHSPTEPGTHRHTPASTPRTRQNPFPGIEVAKPAERRSERHTTPQTRNRPPHHQVQR